MQENIGKGCECIYSFEKFIVDKALEEIIETMKKNVEDTKKAMDEEEKKAAPSRLLEALKGSIPMVERVIDQYEVVRKRFQAMPSCD